MNERVIHLVRHGEVDNPNHVVYADLPGFGLSEMGRRQAAEAGRYLEGRPVAAIVTSPLERARETADALAAGVGVGTDRRLVEIDERLTEWLLARHWAGVAWEALAEERPGEVEAYIADPLSLRAGIEPLTTVVARVAGAVAAALERHPAGEVVLVSHQDPLQAIRLAMTGRHLAAQHTDKPGHAEVVTLSHHAPETEAPWTEIAAWRPEQGPTFPPPPGGATTL
ncbi:MAG TPA: histidine phosphatase family protein [Acidimicrobiia bacterium]|jgi:broad specificity phosphatase PhoE